MFSKLIPTGYREFARETARATACEKACGTAHDRMRERRYVSRFGRSRLRHFGQLGWITPPILKCPDLWSLTVRREKGGWGYPQSGCPKT